MDKYKLYALRKAQIKQLEEEILKLSVEIGEELLNEGEKRKKIDNLGCFTMVERTNWTYTQGTIEKEKELKAAKKLEQKTGLAIGQKAEHLQFTPEGELK